MKIEARIPAICKVLEIIEARVRFNVALQKRIATADHATIFKYFYDYSAATRSALEDFAGNPEATKLCIADCKTMYLTNIQADIDNLNIFVAQLKAALIDVTNLLPVLIYIERKLSHETLDTQGELEDVAQRRKELIKLAKQSAKKAAATKHISGKQLRKAVSAAAKEVAKAESTYTSFAEKTELVVYKDIRRILNAEDVLTKLEAEFIDKYLDVSTSYTADVVPLYHFSLNTNFNRLVSANFKDFNSLNAEVGACKLQIPNFHDRYVPVYHRINHANNQIKLQMKGISTEQELFDIYQTHYSFTDLIQQMRTEFEEAVAEEQEWLAEQQRIADQKRAIEEEKLRLEQERIRLEQEYRAQRKLITFAAYAAATKADEAHQKALRAEQLLQRKKKLAEEAAKAKQAKREKHMQMVKDHRKVYNDKGNRPHSNFKIHPSKIIKHKDELIDLFDPLTKSMKYRTAVTLLGKFDGTVESMHGGSHRTICFAGVLYEYLDISEADNAPLSPNTIKKA